MPTQHFVCIAVLGTLRLVVALCTADGTVQKVSVLLVARLPAWSPNDQKLYCSLGTVAPMVTYGGMGVCPHYSFWGDWASWGVFGRGPQGRTQGKPWKIVQSKFT